MKEKNDNQRLTNQQVLHKKLDAAGWSLFFVWVGIALFAHVGWGAGLLGVSIIILGIQAIRKYFGLELEGFWVAAGFFFALGGIWKLFHIQFGLIPVLCIAVGVVLLVSTLVGKPGDSILCRHR